MKCDFSGFATKAGLKCSDGLTILPGAFQGQAGQQVPLVWQHNYNSPENVLGHAVLSDRGGSVYAEAYFNDTPMAKTAKELVQHKDINMMSIAANKLKKRGFDVMHGQLNEVSLVIAGANPGACIDFINLEHNADDGTDSGEAIIYTGIEFDTTQHADDNKSDGDAEEDDGDETVQDILDTFNQKQRDVLAYLINETENDSAQHSDQEGLHMNHNIFENGGDPKNDGTELTHAQIATIFQDAQKLGSLKESVLAHADEYGIGNIDLLFPDYKSLGTTPQFIKRRNEWVQQVFGKITRQPFSRVKVTFADITDDEARARGYIKGNLKRDEYIQLKNRKVSPTTIYKKQRLDRDDILDITDFDVVAWIIAEMRVMLDEEIARAILVGDGRPLEDPAHAGNPNPDKINEENIIPVWKDSELFVERINLTATLPSGETKVTPEHTIEQVLRSRQWFEGSGVPTLYTTPDLVTDVLLLKDLNKRRIYMTEQEVAAAFRVGDIVEVPVMRNLTRKDSKTGKTMRLLGIIVNLNDYTVGADKGGEITSFAQFDIDYNQEKRLLETRASGALTKYKSAIILEEEVASTGTGGTGGNG